MAPTAKARSRGRSAFIGRAFIGNHDKKGKDKAVAVAIEAQHERDDTLGHRKLAVLLHMGKNRVKRVMRKYGITARRKKKR
jgi:hypothetical protein